jgi:hypothetical protein
MFCNMGEATMHKAITDYTADDDRYMRRTTISGLAPRG